MHSVKPSVCDPTPHRTALEAKVAELPYGHHPVLPRRELVDHKPTFCRWAYFGRYASCLRPVGGLLGVVRRHGVTLAGAGARMVR